MKASALTDLAVNGAVGFSVLAAGAVVLAAMKHEMDTCECCIEPTDSEPDDDDDQVDDPDGDAWDRGHDRWVADDMGAL